MWSFQFVSNKQGPMGDLMTTVQYANGEITFVEDYTDANSAVVISTINNRLSQLQLAEDFVVANPSGQNPISIPLSVLANNELPIS